VGRVLQPPLSAAEIRGAARDLLENPSYRENARSLREEMLALRGPERAVELLERLAEQRRPPVAG
jgi:UDP:flavonoid glycosyltransferase YjiC (YdhE family)